LISIGGGFPNYAAPKPVCERNSRNFLKKYAYNIVIYASRFPTYAGKFQLMSEGVRKFEAKSRVAAPLKSDDIRQLNIWRDILFLLELIGRNSGKYEGYAYGNVSKLLAPFNRPATQKHFIISGSQTSSIPHLDINSYTIVTRCDAAAGVHGLVEWSGHIAASSESMTHAAVYDAYPRARFIFHAHSHEIWKHAKRLKIPVTNPKFEYGTPEIAGDVRRLFKTGPLKSVGIFAMGGHEDGIVSFGRTADEAGMRMISFLAKARALR
jgi:ribulose-5-phosphate 4-epimerase/fuculose-1-phosphate aldolase